MRTALCAAALGFVVMSLVQADQVGADTMAARHGPPMLKPAPTGGDPGAEVGQAPARHEDAAPAAGSRRVTGLERPAPGASEDGDGRMLGALIDRLKRYAAVAGAQASVDFWRRGQVFPDGAPGLGLRIPLGNGLSLVPSYRFGQQDRDLDGADESPEHGLRLGASLRF